MKHEPPTKCPNCESLETEVFEELAEFNDRKRRQLLQVRLVRTRCEDCDHEFVTNNQAQENERRVNAQRSIAGGAPSAQAIRSLRSSWGLTVERAGDLFGGGPVAFSKYENGDVVPAQAMARLLTLAVGNVVTRNHLELAAKGSLVAHSGELRQYDWPDVEPSTRQQFANLMEVPSNFKFEMSRETRISDHSIGSHARRQPVVAEPLSINPVPVSDVIVEYASK